MRSTVITISYLFFGASILIFVSALVIPLLRQSSLQERGSKPEIHAMDALKEPFEKSAPDQTQGAVAVNQMESAAARPEGRDSANDIADAGNRADASTMQVQQNLPETTIPPLQQKLPESVNSKASIEKSAQEQVKDADVINQAEESTTTRSKDRAASNDNALAKSWVDSNAVRAKQTEPESAIDQGYDKLPESVNRMEAKEKPSSVRKSTSLLVIGDGLFSVGEGEPRAGLEEAIEDAIPFINARSSDMVVVEGHADKWIPRGVNPGEVSRFNKIISLQRARTVAMVLEQKGIAPDRIIVKGLGDAAPVASNRTRQGRAKNRRVEIKLVPARQ